MAGCYGRETRSKGSDGRNVSPISPPKEPCFHKGVSMAAAHRLKRTLRKWENAAKTDWAVEICGLLKANRPIPDDLMEMVKRRPRVIRRAMAMLEVQWLLNTRDGRWHFGPVPT